MGNYYWRCLKMAFSGRLGRADTISGIITVILATIANIRPFWGGTVNTLMWVIPLAVLVGTVMLGLILAPYLVHKEDVREADKVRQEKAELECKLNDKQKLREMREQLGLLMNWGQDLKSLCANEKISPPIDEANDWASKVEAFLSEQLDTSYVSIFRNTAGVPMTANSISSIPHRNLWAKIHTRLYQIEQILNRL